MSVLAGSGAACALDDHVARARRSHAHNLVGGIVTHDGNTNAVCRTASANTRNCHLSVRNRHGRRAGICSCVLIHNQYTHVTVASAGGRALSCQQQSGCGQRRDVCTIQHCNTNVVVSACAAARAADRDRASSCLHKRIVVLDLHTNSRAARCAIQAAHHNGASSRQHTAATHNLHAAHT